MSRPNLSNYGTHGESAFPGYWDRVLRAWSPVLGQTGGRIYDFSRNNRWGITTGINLSTQWGTFRGNTGLSHDGVDDWVDFGSNDFSGTDFSVVSWFRILTTGVHFPYSLSAGTNSSGPEILYGPGFVFSQITSRLNGSGTGTLTYDFGSTSAALADPICFVQCFSDSQATKTHSIFVNGGNFQSTTYSISITPTQNWSWAKRGTQFFVAGGGGSNANGTCQWFEQIVFRGILTANEVAELYQLGPGGLYQRRRRRYSFELVSGGAQAITANLLNNSNTFYNATVTQSTLSAPQTITASFFTNTNTFYNATVTPGAANISASLLSNTNSFPNATVTPGAVTVSANLLSNTNTFPNATVTPGAANISANLHTNSNTFYNATVGTGAASQDISANRLSNSNTFYNATVTPGTATISANRLESSNSFPSATVSSTRAITANLVPSTAQVFNATVSRSNNIQTDLVLSTNQFYSASVTSAAQIAANRLNNSQSFPGATISTSGFPQTVSANLLSNTNFIFDATVAQEARAGSGLLLLGVG